MSQAPSRMQLFDQLIEARDEQAWFVRYNTYGTDEEVDEDDVMPTSDEAWSDSNEKGDDVVPLFDDQDQTVVFAESPQEARERFEELASGGVEVESVDMA